MKKNLFFLPLFAALAFAGCSNEEDVLNEEGTGSTETTPYGYVAVSIVQPKSAGFGKPNSVGTRAASMGFEYGSSEENGAQTGLFFIFGSDGTTMYGAPQFLSLSGEGTGNSPEVERIYNTVLVIDGKDDEHLEDRAKQIVCILNPPAGIEVGVTTLAQLQAKIDNYSISEPGKFIMTNSVYRENSRTIVGTRVEDDNICTSAAAALNNPVEIFVERVVAKVKATAVAKMTNTVGANPNVEGEDKHFSINITGIEIANIAETAYLFKSLTNVTFTAPWGWVNDATNKRTYWENCPEDLTYSNKSYNQIIEGFDPDATISEYIQPNTKSQKTAILVTAQLMDGNNPADLVYLRGGYFTQEGALNLIAQYVANNGYYKKTGAKTEEDGTETIECTQLDADDFMWEDKHDNPDLTWLKSYEVVAKVKEGVTDLYKKTQVEGKDVYTELGNATEINDLLKGSAENAPLYKARVYTDGKCYYFVNIDQSSVAGAALHTYDGVVRNHIYDLNLQTISGIGTPVFDPEDIIIPERPENEELYYLAATVEVLAWRLVKQDVMFEGN